MAKKREGNTSNVADVKGAINRNIPYEGVYLGVEAVAGNRGPLCAFRLAQGR